MINIDDIIKNALLEDIPSDDITTEAICDNSQGEVSLIAKQAGIIAGLFVFKRVFTYLDNTIEFKDFFSEGDHVDENDVILKVTGNVKSILMAERTALNLLQRMSGIATQTSKYIKALGDERIKIMDTRKTTPNLRALEKYAVRVGGGNNHRYNLSDAIMIKDNHIDAAGSIKMAVQKVRDYTPFIKKIEVETATIDMVKEALEAGADIIMLDNMDLDMVKQAIEIIKGNAIIECSGNINLSNISRYKGYNIDYISCGALTNSFSSLDLSMKNLVYMDKSIESD